MPNNYQKNIAALGLVWELLYNLAIPVVVFTLVGNYLDKKLGYSFLFILIGGVLGIGLAIFIVYKKSASLKKRFYPKGK
ncbi:MAG TPA: AtpZ/AtpI family protein [bacterium]|nr:AtpZ/AtpI family protein [bacterium]